MSTATLHAWPNQVRLPGQAAAHPGPVDLTRTYLMHHAFRRDLADFRQATTWTPLDETVTWLSLAVRWRLLAAMVRRHHLAEDTGLRPALRRLTDPWGCVELDESEAEHDAIDVAIDAVSRRFDTVTPPPGAAAHARLVEAIQHAAALMTAHLEREERGVLRMVQEVLTQEEWSAIEEAHFTSSIPAADVVALVPWLLHRVPGPIRRDHLARAGRAEHLVWLGTRASFARRERLAFAHAG